MRLRLHLYITWKDAILPLSDGYVRHSTFLNLSVSVTLNWPYVVALLYTMSPRFPVWFAFNAFSKCIYTARCVTCHSCTVKPYMYSKVYTGVGVVYCMWQNKMWLTLLVSLVQCSKLAGVRESAAPRSQEILIGKKSI